ncbi:transcription factor MUTE-like [Elaeis guineensis]|uniref:Transcription factor MUTE-like n=1 Tax=Elaeis guineensis var. tenera TaxID=51953 RepID=A0A6I9QDR6_ELAGV|nr:transcription factor MUTE-like [Elaeis guineensis]
MLTFHPSSKSACMCIFICEERRRKSKAAGRQILAFFCESERRKNMSHITVERNRRRQMNEHIKVLRSLTPSFYIKRGDQASIIGGAIEFIKELHQVLQSLEAKKRRTSLSPSPTPSPRPLLQLTPSPTSNNTYDPDIVRELGACCNSPVADVEAKISGSNVLLRTLSKRIPGQVIKIITVLEKWAFEILHLNISSMEDTVLYSFVIKIGFDCQLSVEELALEVQQSFSKDITY